MPTTRTRGREVSLNYERDSHIDPMDLERELVRQPQFVIQYGDVYAEKRAEKERIRELMLLVKQEAKAVLDRARADIELEIRRTPSSQLSGRYGVEKLTEAVVQALVNTSDRYIQAMEQYSNMIKEVVAEYEEAIKQNTAYKMAMEAFRDRRSSLEGLIKLRLAGFYGEVRVGSTVEGADDFSRQSISRDIADNRQQVSRNLHGRRTTRNASNKNTKR